MKLKEDLGLVPRTLYVLIGLTLGAATLASAWHDWPLIQAHKQSMIGFGLMLLIALLVSALIILWACIGRHQLWHIGDDHVRMHWLSLTSWQKTLHVKGEDVVQVTLDSAAFEDRGNRTACWVTVTLKDGKTYRSPKTFDRAQAEQAKSRIEAAREGART